MTIIYGDLGTDRVVAEAVRTALASLGLPSKFYESPEQTITAGGGLTLPHGLGGKPKIVQFSLVCKVAEGGYSVGDECAFMTNEYFSTGGGVLGFTITLGATNLELRYTTNATPFQLLNKTAGTLFAVTNANWRLVVRAWA